MSKSKVVVITGVSSGIGRVTAALFAQQDFRVFGTVRNVAGVLPITGVELVAMDIRRDDSIAEGIQSVIDQAGQIDVLVNNAGTTLVGAVEESSTDEAYALFDTNVFGMLRTIKAVLPQMRAQKHGRIVNVSSVLGFLPAPYMGLYSASKHAVEGLSESLDHEVRQFGIRVSLVEPSFTKTNLDLNAPMTALKIMDYQHERNLSTSAVVKNVQGAPAPDSVAHTIVKAATGRWKMRHTPAGEATLLSKLRRFMPSGPVSAGIRKNIWVKLTLDKAALAVSLNPIFLEDPAMLAALAHLSHIGNYVTESDWHTRSAQLPPTRIFSDFGYSVWSPFE